MAKFFKRYRPLTWFILLVNLVMLIWVITGVASGQNTDCDPSLSAEDCKTAQDVGTTVGVVVILFVWAVVDVILGVLWLITRKSHKSH